MWTDSSNVDTVVVTTKELNKDRFAEDSAPTHNHHTVVHPNYLHIVCGYILQIDKCIIYSFDTIDYQNPRQLSFLMPINIKLVVDATGKY